MFTIRKIKKAEEVKIDYSPSWRQWFVDYGLQIIKGGAGLLGLTLFGGLAYGMRDWFQGPRENSDRRHGLKITELGGSASVVNQDEDSYSLAARDLKSERTLTFPEISCSASLIFGTSTFLSTGNPLFFTSFLACLPAVKAEFDCSLIKHRYEYFIQYHYLCDPSRILGNQTEITKVIAKYEVDVLPADNCIELGQADCTGLYSAFRNCGLSEQQSLTFLMDRANRGAQRCYYVFDKATVALYLLETVKQSLATEFKALQTYVYLNDAIMSGKIEINTKNIGSLLISTGVLDANFSAHLTDYVRLYTDFIALTERVIETERGLTATKTTKQTAENVETTTQWLVALGIVLMVFEVWGIADTLETWLVMLDWRNKLKLEMKRLRSDCANLFYRMDNFHPAFGTRYARFKENLYGIWLKLAFFCHCHLEFADKLGAEECSLRSIFAEQKKFRDMFEVEDPEAQTGTTKNLLIIFKIYKDKLYFLYKALHETIYDQHNAHFNKILEIQGRYLRKTKNLREAVKYLQEMLQQFHLLIKYHDLSLVSSPERQNIVTQQLEIVRKNIAFYETQLIAAFVEDEKIPLEKEKREVTLIARVDEHSTTLGKLVAKHGLLRKKHDQLQVDHTDLVKRHEQLGEQYMALEAAHKQLANDYQELKIMHEKLEGEYTALSELHHKHIKAISQKLKNADGKLDATRSELEGSIKQEITTLTASAFSATSGEKIRDEIKQRAIMLSDLVTQFKDLRTSCERLQQDLQNLAKRCDKFDVDGKKLVVNYSELQAASAKMMEDLTKKIEATSSQRLLVDLPRAKKTDDGDIKKVYESISQLRHEHQDFTDMVRTTLMAMQTQFMEVGKKLVEVVELKTTANSIERPVKVAEKEVGEADHTFQRRGSGFFVRSPRRIVVHEDSGGISLLPKGSRGLNFNREHRHSLEFSKI